MPKRYTVTRDKFLSTDEFKRLLRTCEEQAELDILNGRRTWVTRHMLVALALRSGLRVAEIANLKVGHIYITGKEARLFVVNGKGKKDRDVYFNGSLVKPLNRYLEIKAKSWREPCGPDDYLFSSKVRDGRSVPYTTTALHISFKKALEKAGLPMHHTIHHARHTYATFLLADTNNLKYVQKQLGHENITFTAIYADVQPERCQALADKLSI